jgi:adenylate kinase
MIVIVTGTPGTGKTTFAKKYAKEHKLKYIDVNKLIEEKKLYDGIDKERDSKIVDTKKLSKELVALSKKEKSMVIDSHLSHYLPKECVDKCFVTKCSLPGLKKRLEKRGYSEKKVRENMDAEIFDICRQEALENGHMVETIVTG